MGQVKSLIISLSLWQGHCGSQCHYSSLIICSCRSPRHPAVFKFRACQHSSN